MRMSAPGAQSPPLVPAGVETIDCRSGELALKAYLVPAVVPKSDASPGILYSHGGCAITEQDFEAARIFSEAGYAVLLPTYRGEHGNPGAYELFFGEVDDACAALLRLADRPEVDASRLHAFGYSMGGEIAALLSLIADLPLMSTGSCGPFFLRLDPFSSESMYGAPIPFDPTDEREIESRLLSYRLDEMARPHIACIGRQDEKFADGRWRDVSTVGRRLRIIEVDGTHDTSLLPAIRAFLSEISET